MPVLKNTFFLLLLFLLACRKEHRTTDGAAQLAVSADTIRFDTVFTGAGTITQAFKIFNTNNAAITIASVRLMSGAASPFKINANGTPGPVIENLDIAANDSAYVFVTATVPASTVALPFVVQDSIAIIYNGNEKKVQLEAYGQNAHFLRKYTVAANTTWNADLPYVLLDTFTVAAGAQLTIAEGCKIYLHANAAFVVQGQLTVQGQHWDSTRVVFAGDRLDAPYRDLPGTWPGIIFQSSSHDNQLQYAVLKNAVQAISVEASPVTSKLYLAQIIIDNTSDAGIIATNANLTAQNILVSNCGRNIVLQNGGTYMFIHATVASFSTPYLAHKRPVLTISNPSGTASNLKAVFRNCIFWGESGDVVPDEVVVQRSAGAFDVLFDGVLWPLANAPQDATITQPALTDDPEFETINIEENTFDFHLKETSPARNGGVASSVSLDLDGRPRPVGAPDLGAYEEQ